MAQQPEFELTYFNGRGLAETSRFIFAYTRTPYSDKRFPLEVIDFKNRKFKREEFEKAKAAGELVLSMGILILSFILTTWFSGKIYRTGILMYGKKASYREVWKWIKYK